MLKHRKWLIIAAAFALVVSSYPILGAAEGNGEGQAEVQAAETNTAETAGESTSGAAGTTETSTTGADTTAAAGTTAATDTATAAPAVSLTPITATKKMIENEQYELYIDEKTGNIRVVDKRTTAQWLGSPQVPRTTMPNNKKFIDSPVHVRYTEGSDIVQTYTLKEAKNKLAIKKQDDGSVRVTFTFTKEKLTVAVEYRLTEDGLTVTIPDKAIKEKGTAKLVSIEALPFWNAASGEEQGALFIPDGSGALITYKKEHPQYFAGYSETIYGADTNYDQANYTEVFSDEWRKAMWKKEKIALPVFGNYRGGIASLGIVQNGQYDAKINATPSGIRAISLYRTSTEFLYRKQDVIFIGTSGQIPFFQAERMKGDREIRYLLLQGEDANYVGMAKAYREFLQEEQDVKAVKQDGVPLNIRLYGGLTRDDVIGTTFVSMTTFEQAKTIIDDYAAQGITDLELTFEGWSEGGKYGDQPDHFPVEKKLGGEKELKELSAYAKQKGAELYLQANYARAYSESDGLAKKKDAIRGMDREVKENPNFYVSDRWNNDDQMFYLLKPERVVNDHVSKELDDYAKLGIDGVQLSYWGEMLYSDLDPDSVTQRSQTAETWAKATSDIQSAVGRTAVDYGFAYMLGRVNRIDNAPLDSSHFIYEDETIPFYQIVMHGLVPYTAKPANLRDDSVGEMLRMLEYGALPSLELTSEPTSNMQRTMEERLWSSEASSWLAPSAKEYKAVAEVYQHIAGKAITNHEKLSRKVYRTTYEGGTQVLVNYGDSDASHDGVTVPAQSFAYRGGGN
ncbi:putative small secreted protein [Paenibacillus phyllosphaerae]|uniref:Putative small secreted protein n=1 Tax=Paenibacillus phyllosphaerae TaxID=274593 RepID=A0A7W5AU31_9BACL|nr:DUF5696 domain-containing protein [Paenibacillus phyllosphaerae]MBB3108798.1 putative small secreted protein [Paenibacillus phyllosphaerae]